ncbi:branched-chain amino acid ABC transporter permease [Deinococcus taklimakanensis]|uniref:Branched-chain amino acid ABC transporter permease n=1 Tax=Deinococcus taklimakanensis TaxID=536443 RepID=A0ABW5P3V4_9DEIO
MTTTALPLARPRALTFGNVTLSLVVLAALLVYPFVFGKFMNFGVATLIFAGLAMAWNILGGWAGQKSLGHAALLGVGAYTMTLLATPERVPAFLGGPVAPWWGALIGMLIATLLAAVWGGLTFRLRGSYFTLSTIAVALVLRLIAINSEWTGGSEGLFMPELPRFLGLDLFDRRAEYWLALAFLALTLLITHLIRRSRLGYALQAVREDEDGARALGIDPTRMKVVAFMISAALTALGGSLYALYLQAFEPHTLLEMPISIQIALMAIIGGRGSIQGPVIGALLIATLGELFRNVFSNANLLIYGVLILVVTLFAPGGIMGLFDRKSSKLGTAR